MTSATSVLNKLSISVQRDELIEALRICDAAAQRHSTIPILGAAKLETEGERLRVVATDLDITAKLSIPASVAHPGGLAIDLKALLDALKFTDSDDVHIAVDEKQWAQVQCGTSKFRIPAWPVEDYPTEPVPLEVTATIDMEPGALQSALKATSFAAVQEETRWRLNGVLFAAQKRQIEMVATDGHRMAMLALTDTRPGAEAKVLIPTRAIKAVSLLEGALKLQIGTNLTIASEKVTFVVRIADINFPSYREVIAKDLKRHAVTDRARLLAMVKGVASFSNHNTRSIKLTFTPGRLTIEATNVDRGDAVSYMPIDYDGEKVSVGLNSLYVSDALAAMAAEHILVSFTDENSQVHFQPHNEGGPIEELHLLMPMRLA